MKKKTFCTIKFKMSLRDKFRIVSFKSDLDKKMQFQTKQVNSKNNDFEEEFFSFLISL